MDNLVGKASFNFKPKLSNEQIARLVKEKYKSVLDICVKKAIEDGPDWRNPNKSGAISNAQLWILGACLGHASTFETDADLEEAIRRKG